MRDKLWFSHATDTNIRTGDDARRKPSCLGADARDKAGMLWLVVYKNIMSQPCERKLLPIGNHCHVASQLHLGSINYEELGMLPKQPMTLSFG